jgi:hypothetical protein
MRQLSLASEMSGFHTSSLFSGDIFGQKGMDEIHSIFSPSAWDYSVTMGAR